MLLKHLFVLLASLALAAPAFAVGEPLELKFTCDATRSPPGGELPSTWGKLTGPAHFASTPTGGPGGVEGGSWLPYGDTQVVTRNYSPVYDQESVAVYDLTPGIGSSGTHFIIELTDARQPRGTRFVARVQIGDTDVDLRCRIR
jgi:hypothetical protein